MKVAISARGTHLGCQMDSRFGRASYFLIMDTDSGQWVAHDNRDTTRSVSGAGIQASKAIVDLGVTVVITGHMGSKALDVLLAGGVEVYAGVSGTAQNALRRFQAGELESISRPDVQGHWSPAASSNKQQTIT